MDARLRHLPESGSGTFWIRIPGARLEQDAGLGAVEPE